MSRNPSHIVGIDLGNHSYKAVHLQKKGDQFVLSRAAMVPVQKGQEGLTEQSVAAQIKDLAAIVKTSGADTHFSVNSLNSTVRYVELPAIPLHEVRSALKINSATYLRQNFENFVFDACPLDPEGAASLTEKKSAGKRPPGGKIKILVGGVASAEAILYFHAARRAGIKPLSLQLSSVSLINGFEASQPEVFANQAVALLDIGFLSSTLTILDKGKPLLTRSVPVGGKQITEYLATMAGVDFIKAESSKLQGDPNLEEAVARTCATLVREVRSSINFFEKNSDQPISKVYMTGGSVHSQTVIDALAKDIGTPCDLWDSSRGLAIELPSDQRDIFNRNRAGFAAALGTVRTFARLSKPKEVATSAAPTPQPVATGAS